MKHIFLLCLLAMVGRTLAQPALTIGTNTRVAGTGAAQLVYGGGALTNNGSLSLPAGQLTATGPVTYGGTGTATVATALFNHSTGTTTLNSLLSVTDRATLSANANVNANGQLYLRTDGFPNANLVNNAALSGTVQGLVTNATVKTGTTTYSSQLTTNVSGGAMKYQWQSSANNSQWSDVPGANQSTYTASVSATTYYRCLLTTTNTAYSQTTPAVQLVLTPTATPPLTPALPNQTATVGTPFSYTVPSFGGTEPVTYTASGLPGGLLFDPATRIISGTPTTVETPTVNIFAFNAAGASGGQFTIAVSAAPVVSGPFAITGVTTIDCTPVNNRININFNPRYAGVNGQPISFSVVNELSPTTAAGPYTLQLYPDNPTIVLKATQSGTAGEASFSYNWLAACNSLSMVSPNNTAPTVVNAIPPQSATVGQGFTYQIPANTFTDAETPNQLTLSANGLPPGLSFNGTTISGTPSTTDQSPYSVTVTATDPGNLSVATRFTLTVRPAASVPPTGTFSITGVTTIDCTPVANRISINFNPRYAGVNGQPISFSVVNELSPTTAPGPYSLTLYPDNPTIVLKAVQSGTTGEVSFTYNWLAACNGATPPPPPANQPPTTTGIANQNGMVGQPFSLNVAPSFSDPNGDVLTFTASGLPAGLSLSGSTINGTPSVSGVSSVTVTATDPGNLSVSTSFTLTISPAPVGPPPTATFSITGVTTVSCVVLSAGQRQIQFTPRYAGLTGQPVSFSVVNELSPTTSPGPYTLNAYTDNPTFVLKATQTGTPGEVSFTYNWLVACNGGEARVSAVEPAPRFTLQVLGNPVQEQVRVLISGAEGQAVRLRLTDIGGHELESRLIEQAGRADEQRFDLRQTPAGVLLLQGVSRGQVQTVKIIRQ